MNMDHLNFVVEARYYGYWIALVFAIICLTMFVYVKILDARKQKERLNAERKRIHSDAILTKELVRKLSGFFMLEENCRGYDPNTPIGEIAKHAFLHWQWHEQEVEELKRTIRRNADLLELEKEKVANARKIACDYQDVIHYVEEKERYQKHKRCMAMARWCDVTALFYGNNIPKVLNKDITDSRRQKVFRRLKHYKKWHTRWLEFAKQFKE